MHGAAYRWVNLGTGFVHYQVWQVYIVFTSCKTLPNLIQFLDCWRYFNLFFNFQLLFWNWFFRGALRKSDFVWKNLKIFIFRVFLLVFGIFEHFWQFFDRLWLILMYIRNSKSKILIHLMRVNSNPIIRWCFHGTIRWCRTQRRFKTPPKRVGWEIINFEINV